jgi:hypothetical protein
MAEPEQFTHRESKTADRGPRVHRLVRTPLLKKDYTTKNKTFHPSAPTPPATIPIATTPNATGAIVSVPAAKSKPMLQTPTLTTPKELASFSFPVGASGFPACPYPRPHFQEIPCHVRRPARPLWADLHLRRQQGRPSARQGVPCRAFVSPGFLFQKWTRLREAGHYTADICEEDGENNQVWRCCPMHRL